MSQPVASSSRLTTVPPTWAAVRLMPSRTNPVGAHVAAMVEAGTAARAIVPKMVEAVTRLATLRLVMNDMENAPSRGSCRDV